MIDAATIMVLLALAAFLAKNEVDHHSLKKQMKEIHEVIVIKKTASFADSANVSLKRSRKRYAGNTSLADKALNP